MTGRAQAGFGLVEILITVAVIAFGIMAHITFQRFTFHEAGLAISRAKASEAATIKLEDLQSFGCLKTGACGFAFQDIASDVGGNLVAASNQLVFPAATAFAVDNTSYVRHWTVTNYWYTGTNTAPTTTIPSGSPIPSFKSVTVTVSWTDSNGTAQSLNLNAVIAGADPANSARVYQ